MTKSADSKRICVPESFLKLLLQYFAEGIGEGEHLVEVLVKNLSESESPRLQTEDVNRLVGLALYSGNMQLARMIGRHLRTGEDGPHLGLTLGETVLSVSRCRR